MNNNPRQSEESRVLRSQQERTSHILQTSADYPARKIFLFGDIDDESAYRTVVALNLMDTSDGDITILMHTCGGHVESGWAIFDAVRACKNPVTIVGYGAVMSMGAVIMQAADLRLMAPRCRMMFHTGNVSMPGEQDSDKLISVGEEIAGIRGRFIELFAERSHLNESQVRELLLAETYFSAEEARVHGFIDGVLVLPEKKTRATEKLKRGTKKNG
jgi:ATP-dependent Clp protease protease subunit